VFSGIPSKSLIHFYIQGFRYNGQDVRPKPVTPPVIVTPPAEQKPVVPPIVTPPQPPPKPAKIIASVDMKVDISKAKLISTTPVTIATAPITNSDKENDAMVLAEFNERIIFVYELKTLKGVWPTGEYKLNSVLPDLDEKNQVTVTDSRLLKAGTIPDRYERKLVSAFNKLISLDAG